MQKSDGIYTAVTKMNKMHSVYWNYVTALIAVHMVTYLCTFNIRDHLVNVWE